MDELALAAIILHGVACFVLVAYAIAQRRSEHRRDAFALAIVWCAMFLSARIGEFISELGTPDGDVPLSGLYERTLLAVEHALYFAWPLGLAAWMRWTFVRARALPLVVLWLLSFGVPTALYPLIRGSSWFRLAAAVHIIAFVLEIVAIRQWWKRREKPRPWHGVGIVASWVSTLPAIAFLFWPDSLDSYGLWALRGQICLHLWVLALMGGAKWMS